jgi:hypothetical protein
LHINHVFNPTSWNIVQSWGYEQSIGRDDPTGSFCRILGWSKFHQTGPLAWGGFPHRIFLPHLGPKDESLSFPVYQVSALCWDSL